jgi:hypothetical protein
MKTLFLLLTFALCSVAAYSQCTVDGYYVVSPDGPHNNLPLPTSPTPNTSSANYIRYDATITTSGLANVVWSTSGATPYVFQPFTTGFMLEMISNSLVTVILDADAPCGHIHKEYPFLSVFTH